MKYLLFLEDVISDDRLVKFFKNQRYKVTYEGRDHYVLPEQGNQKCGIGKECENILYKVVGYEKLQ